MAADELLRVENLVKYFPVKSGVLGREHGQVHAVDGISFGLRRGETLSLVGESGSGKTTAGRAVLRLLEPTAGRVVFDGVDVTGMAARDLRLLRKRMQIIFQDPYSSLNPRITVYNMLAEALAAHKVVPRAQRRDRVYELLGLVGLPAEAADRYPHEFSGGQRQRIGIARALAVAPDLIVADEPVSALDVSIQAQILNLMRDIQQKLGLTYLFIGHNLSVVRHISDRVAVMYLGRIVELAPAEALFATPVHPYTRLLLQAAPIADPAQRRRRDVLAGETPSPIHPPPGCHFHPRCPDRQPKCSEIDPGLVEVAPGHWAACCVHAPGAMHEKPAGIPA